MIKIELGDLPFNVWNDIFNWLLKPQHLERCGIDWTYDPKSHDLYLSDKFATIYLLKWSHYEKAHLGS